MNIKRRRQLSCAAVKRYQKKNYLQIQMYNHFWRLANPVKHQAQTRRTRKKHPRAMRNWQILNPHKVKMHNAKRRARRCTAKINHIEEIQRKYAKCQVWRDVGFDVVVDHIIPLAKGGAHAPENLQIIYSIENRQKHARLDYVPLVIFF
jgi:5-methylcytosine-specific restriction endonuclease McrA